MPILGLALARAPQAGSQPGTASATNALEFRIWILLLLLLLLKSDKKSMQLGWPNFFRALNW